MKYLFFGLIIGCLHQTGFSQINLTFDARAPLTSMKLSEITEDGRYIAIGLDSIGTPIATDGYFFIRSFSKQRSGVYQFDLSGKLIRTFTNDRSDFRVDTQNNRLILISSGHDVSVWDLNGIFIKNISLPPRVTECSHYDIHSFGQNFIWIQQDIVEKDRITVRISRLNLGNERLETIMERNFTKELHVILPHFHFSSVGGRLYVSDPINTIYQINGTQIRSAVNYNILNYSEQFNNSGFPSYNVVFPRGFFGRYIYIGYTNRGAMHYLYDTIKKRSWNFSELTDDVFHTGGTKDFRITQNGYLIFEKKGADIPKGVNAERGSTVFFITKLKQ